MAQLPGTQFATGSPSGRTGQTLWNPPREGGGEQIAEGISKLGAVTLNYALNVQKQEMAAEYYEKRRLIDEAGWAAHNAVTGDEEADKALWDKFQSDAQAVAGSSKYKDVNDELTQHVNQVSPNWQQGMFTTSLKIRSDNADDELRLNYNKILENGIIDENGRIPEGVEMLDNMLALGSITKTKYNALVASMPGDIHIARADRLMKLGTYNLALTELAATDKMELTTEQLEDIRVLRLEANKQKGKNDEKFVMDINAMLAEDKYPLSDVLDLIRKRTDIDATQKTNLAEVAIHGAKVWEETGVNPWKETRDESSFWQARDAIFRGLITTRKQLLDLQLSDPKNGPLWSHTAFNDLVMDLPSEDASGFSSDPVVKGYLATFRALYTTDEDFPMDKLEEYAPKFGELTKALRAKYKAGDYRGMHDEFERVANTAKDKKAKEWLSGLAGIKKGLGYAWRPSSMISDLWTGKYMKKQKEPEKSTEKSPFPDYPDAYLEDGMWTVMKDGKKYRIQP